MAVSPDDDTRGIVRPDALGRAFTLERIPPGRSLDRFVERMWAVRWDLPTGTRHDQPIVTHPAVNIVFEDGASTVGGVSKDVFVRTLAGRGSVVGVMFRPGGFRPFLGASMSTITGHTLDIANVFGEAGTALAGAVDPEDLESAASAMGRFLAERAPREHTLGEDVSDIVDLIVADDTLVSVGDLALRLDMHPRRLQRLFAEHIGVGPKWVIDRSRLHAVGEEAARPARRSWAELAAALGFADQAHMTRRFASTFGEPPARYAGLIRRRG